MTWRVRVNAGDKVSVHATYDTRRADWYEVMGIMPVAVYDGTDVGGKDAQASDIPQVRGPDPWASEKRTTTTAGSPTGAADPFSLPSAPVSNRTIGIQSFTYQADLSAGLC